MEKGILSLLQDESISDQCSVAHLMNKIQVQISSANTVFLLEDSFTSMLKMPQCQEFVA
jgi:hypothetical protein